MRIDRVSTLFRGGASAGARGFLTGTWGQSDVCGDQSVPRRVFLNWVNVLHTYIVPEVLSPSRT